MKIADILKGKGNLNRPMESGEAEADKLKQQREDLNKEVEDNRYREQLQQGQQPQQQQQFQQPQQSPQPQQQQQYRSPESKADLEPPKYEEPPTLFKLTFVLEDGTRLNPVIECMPDKLDEIMEAIDLHIISGEIITIGEYKIIPSRIMYIDLKGRD